MRPFVFIILIFFFSILEAQLSPGDLSKVHEKYEGVKNCNECHSSELGIDPQKCLKCHEPLAKQIEKGKGLHANKDYKNCQTCHVDHLGRDNELVWWKGGKNNFNHDLTGYVLEGAHKKIACDKCHLEKNITEKEFLKKFSKDLNRTYLGLSQKCLSCHLDEHKNEVSDNCISCHIMDAWKPAKNFDHNTAKFKLTGAHVKTACEKCHAPGRSDQKDVKFKFTSLKFSTCIACHSDPHDNRFGSSCTNCHTTSDWQAQVGKNFNHDLTGYPLQGAHLSVKCDQCHKQGRRMKPLAHDKCIRCHNDYHQRQFLSDNRVADCNQCHSLNGFSPSNFTIEQHQKTVFKLAGAHLATPCAACHYPVRLKSSRGKTLKFTFSSLECIGCHDNVHNNISNKYMSHGKCTSCHNVESWDEIQFDHKQTDFSLEGRHASVRCSKCHLKKKAGNKIKLDLAGLSNSCVSCHADIHTGQFAENGQVDCSKCHVPQDWLAEKFDHNRDSKFEIKGGHVNVPCKSCHKPFLVSGKSVVKYKPINSDCSACHEFRNDKTG